MYNINIQYIYYITLSILKPSITFYISCDNITIIYNINSKFLIKKIKMKIRENKQENKIYYLQL